MKKSLFLFVLVFGWSVSLWAQTAVKADEYFQQQDYAQAKMAYANLLKASPSSALYLYRYARCAYELGEQEEAIAAFERAGEKYALRNFYLGELYLATYRFDAAIDCYQKYADFIGELNERYPYLLSQIEQAQKGARYLKRVEQVTIIDSQLVLKKDFLSAYSLSKEMGSLMQDSLGVCFTNARGDRKIFSAPSHRQKDLLTCQLLLGGELHCDTLSSAVNSDFNEAFPFVLSDGITLYFASDRPEGLGGYDLYLTRYDSNKGDYLTPENLGFPFNSFGNDYLLALDETTHRGYFATDRYLPDSMVAVYTFVPNAEKLILKDLSPDSIRLAAQLKIYDTIPPAPDSVKAEPILSPSSLYKTEQDDFRFVLNNSTCYTQKADFQSADAYALFLEYRHLEAQLQGLKTTLAQKRQQYAKSNDLTGRQALQLEITQLETAKMNLQLQLPLLLQQVRALEMTKLAE